MNCVDFISLVISAIAVCVSIWSVSYTKKQYLSKIRPKLFNNSLSTNQRSRELSFDIYSCGNFAEIICIKAPKDVKIRSRLPIEISKDEYVDIKGIFTGGSIRESLEIKIIYKDIDGHKYKSTMRIGKK